jgi:hypothetical protein
MAYVVFRPTRWSGSPWQQRRKAAMRRSTVGTTTLNRGSLPLQTAKIAPLADYRSMWPFGLTKLQQIEPNRQFITSTSKEELLAYSDPC